MENIILIGAGGHAKSCIDVIEQENKFKIIGLIDFKEKIGEKILNYPIIDSDANLSKLTSENVHFFITLGQIKSAQRRTELFEHLKKHNAKIATIISPLAYISKHAKIGEGTIVMHHAVVNTNASIGDNCIINTKALIEHDAIIEDNCHVSTCAIVNGESKISKGSFIGSNATVVNCVKLEENSFIKAGSLVK